MLHNGIQDQCRVKGDFVSLVPDHPLPFIIFGPDLMVIIGIFENDKADDQPECDPHRDP